MRAVAARVGHCLAAAAASGLLVLASYFVATTLFAIANFGWRAPMADQYRLYSFYLGLPFPDSILQVENGHRPIVPALLRMLEVHCCSASQVLQLVLGSAFALATVAVLVVAIWRAPVPWVTRAAAASTAALGVFWLGNARMLMHGNESVHAYLVTLCVALAAWLAHGAASARTVAPLALGTACCCIATFSFGPGMASFPAMMLVLALHRAPPRHFVLPAAGLVLCLLFYAVLLPGDSSVRNQLLFAPVDNLHTMVRWIASPWVHAWMSASESGFQDWLTRGIARSGVSGAVLRETAAPALLLFGGGMEGVQRLAALLGAAGVLVWLAAGLSLWRRRDACSAAEWTAFGLATFALATAALVSMARARYFLAHPGQLFADRYLVWPSVFWSALAVFAMLRFGRASLVRATACVLVAAILCAMLYPSHRVLASWSATVHRSAERVIPAAWMDLRGGVFPDGPEATAAQVDVTLDRMRARGLGPFADAPPALPGGSIAIGDPVPCGTASVTRQWASPAHGGTPVLQFEGWCSGMGDRRESWVLVADEVGRVHGLGRYSWIRPGALGLRLAVTEKHGFDGFVLDTAPAARYLVVARDAAGAWRTLAILQR